MIALMLIDVQKSSDGDRVPDITCAWMFWATDNT